jgi:hypothetical protein
LVFIQQVYRDYTVKEIGVDDDIKQASGKLRERMLVLSNKIEQFIEQYNASMTPACRELINQLGDCVLKVPQGRFFRTGKRRVVIGGVLHEKNEDELADFDGDESRDLENRMANESVLKLLRDHIIQENVSVKKAMGITDVTNNIFVSREYLKKQIKRMLG